MTEQKAAQSFILDLIKGLKMAYPKPSTTRRRKLHFDTQELVK